MYHQAWHERGEEIEASEWKIAQSKSIECVIEEAISSGTIFNFINLNALPASSPSIPAACLYGA